MMKNKFTFLIAVFFSLSLMSSAIFADTSAQIKSQQSTQKAPPLKPMEPPKDLKPMPPPKPLKSKAPKSLKTSSL